MILRSSTVKLAYQDAQVVINGGSIAESKIAKPVDRRLVEADILMLAVRPCRTPLFAAH